MINPVALLASLMLATSMQPADTPKEQAETEATEKEEADDDSKMICKRTAVIGSKFKKRICATKYEWEKLRERSRDTTAEFQRNKGLEPVN